MRPRLQSQEPVISELGHESVKLTWKPAELPYYSRYSTPITYSVEYQVSRIDCLNVEKIERKETSFNLLKIYFLILLYIKLYFAQDLKKNSVNVLAFT